MWLSSGAYSYMPSLYSTEEPQGGDKPPEEGDQIEDKPPENEGNNDE